MSKWELFYQSSDYSRRRDNENIVLIEQAREIERLRGEVKCKDQVLSRLEEDNDNLKTQINQYKDQLNETLQLIKSENTPSAHYKGAHNLSEKLMLLDSYIRDIKKSQDRFRHSDYEAIVNQRITEKMTPSPNLTRNSHFDNSFHHAKPLKDLYSNSANTRSYSRTEFPSGPLKNNS